MYVLEVLSGPRDGATWKFDAEITIGRDEALAEACITIDRYVSRKHAHLRVAGEAIELTDLSSRNGTSVDGRPVSVETVGIGGRFTVGRTLMRVRRAA